MKRVKQFSLRRLVPAIFWMLVMASPAAAQSGTGDAAAVAEQIRGLLFQVMLIGGPVAILSGFFMMFFGGFNPQWKQRGIEIIKWTILGAVGIAVATGVLWGIIEPLLQSGGAG